MSWILALAILTGQLVRFPLEIRFPTGNSGGATLLDVIIYIFCLIGLFQVKVKLKKPPLTIILALFFILIALLSLILTPLHLGPSEYLISFFYTIRFSAYILLGWLIYEGALSKLKQNINKILFFSGLGMAVLGLMQFIFIPDLGFLSNLGWDPHYFRNVSTFLDPNFAGAYFVLTLLLLLTSKRLPQPLRGFAMAVVYLALLTTFSRSSYLMFLVSSLALSFLKKERQMAFYTILLFLGLMLGFYIYTITISQPRHIDRTQSAQFRLNTWQQGFEIFKHSPILGVGFNSYRYAVREYSLGNSQFLKTRGSSTNDSSLLYVLATTGIIGFLSYVLLLTSLIKSGLKSNFSLIAALFGLLIHSLFANSLFYPFILIWILLKSCDIRT